ncbi:MAG TPA: CarD family transcriptional regulator, partial [Polyangia bacterium]|nr:CarD family transcriptional regulator [Polyangia bacterium]
MPVEFIIGDKAVYPSQGVAEIIGIEKKEVFGRIQRF